MNTEKKDLRQKIEKLVKQTIGQRRIYWGQHLYHSKVDGDHSYMTGTHTETQICLRGPSV